MADEQAATEHRCTISIIPGPGGVMVGVDFGGALDAKNPSLSQTLALLASGVISDYLHELKSQANKAQAQGVH